MDVLTDFDIASAKAGISASVHKQQTVDFFDRLSNKTRCRKIVDSLTYEAIAPGMENLIHFFKEKKAVYEKMKEEEKIKNRNKDEVLAAMKEMGLSLEDIADSVGGKITQVSSAQRMLESDENQKGRKLYTYDYKVTIFNRTYFWYGNGAMPVPFMCAIAKGLGKSRADFKIEDPADYVLMPRGGAQHDIPDAFQEEASELLTIFQEKHARKRRKAA